MIEIVVSTESATRTPRESQIRPELKKKRLKIKLCQDIRGRGQHQLCLVQRAWIRTEGFYKHGMELKYGIINTRIKIIFKPMFFKKKVNENTNHILFLTINIRSYNKTQCISKLLGLTFHFEVVKI